MSGAAEARDRNVLLIEDNEQNRYLLTFLLERSGYTVQAAEDGPRGIALARRAPPAVILLDIQLPGMDGHAVARALRQDAALGATPIIAVTSYAMPGDRDKALAAGCSGYLEKPIDPATFVSDLERLVAAARAVTT
ncbi:MAG: response regulator [Kofleriaceae bacterium]|nr:response regulator [Kofleriaceae bacterium]MCL4223449.1 response regulator [Myxococcales bacterium]